MEASVFGLLGASALGALISALLGCLPALHIYNVAGIVVLAVTWSEGLGVAPEVMSCFMMGLVTGYAMVNTVPAIFLGAPDESAVFVTLPGQKLLGLGRGPEAAYLTGVGGLGGVLFLALAIPLAAPFLAGLRQLLSRHMFWILGLVLAFMVLSEWPKGGGRGISRLRRLHGGWKSLLAGIVTLLLSGLLGFILLYKPLIPLRSSFQNIMPAFVGLFALPWVLQNMTSRARVPAQRFPRTLDLSPRLWLRGVAAGAGGGLFAAFFPIVTGGIGGLIAGHATAQRDDRLFIVSQGASKVVYYAGAFLLLFVPALHLRRGGMAWMMSGIFQPRTGADFLMVLGALLVSGALSFLLLLLFVRLCVRLVERVDYRWVSVGALVLIVAIVIGITGPQGLAIAAVSTAIGLLPVTFGSRRMNCMGVLLIPVMLNMAGVGSEIAAFLGVA
jgi:putative membrane protein